MEPDGKVRDQNHIRHTRVIPYNIAQTAKGILARVISGGTGKAAQIGEFAAGKTGTTENYGDAWFVGFNKELTVAVWVGYPDRLKPMLTEYHGSAVAGGTFPAEIWHDFMTSWIKIRDARQVAHGGKPTTPTTTTTAPIVTPTATPTTATTTPAPAQTPAATTPATPAPKAKQPAPKTPAQTQPAPQQPAPTPAPTDGGGGTGTPPPGTATPQTPAPG
jgi:penicillin-binding protein 1A